MGWALRWWLGELAALVPAPVRRFFRAEPDRVVVDISGPETVVLRCSGATCEEVGRVPPGADGEARALARLLSRARRAVTVLRLPQAQALTKPVTLPAAAESELRDVLSHQIDRHTPFTAAEVCFGYRVARREPGTGQLRVELTVVPRKAVETGLERARRWGIAPAVIDVAGEDPLSPPEINLLATDGREGRGKAWPRVNAVLGLTAAALAVAVFAIPLEQRRERAEAAVREVAELRREATGVLALREENDALMRKASFLADKKLGSPAALAVLKELTDVIPEDSWLYELRIDRPEVLVSGYSPSAASLIGLIDDSPMFAAPRFRSPVTRPNELDKERFNLSFEIVPRPGPGAE